LRRLQLAAEHGEAVAFLFRPLDAANTPSPVALRLSVQRRDNDLTVRILKSRGRWAAGTIRLSEKTLIAPAPPHSRTGIETDETTSH